MVLYFASVAAIMVAVIVVVVIFVHNTIVFVIQTSKFPPSKYTNHRKSAQENFS